MSAEQIYSDNSITPMLSCCVMHRNICQHMERKQITVHSDNRKRKNVQLLNLAH